MKKAIVIISFWVIAHGLFGQENVYQTFKDTRVINSQSTEMLPTGVMDVRIAHRFGDLAGTSGGWQTFYGLESASDIMIGVDYGLTNNLNIGLHRTKGAGPLKQNVSGVFKLRLLQQRENGRPFTLALSGVASASTMQKSSNPDVLHNFPESNHRLSYFGQLLLARKFSNRLAVQFTGGYAHRNLVPFEENNGVINAGISGRVQLTKVIGIIVDCNFPIDEYRVADNGFYPSLGMGFEFETGGGHVFQINVTNSQGLIETDFINYTRSDISEGEVRLGFTISRRFKVR